MIIRFTCWRHSSSLVLFTNPQGRSPSSSVGPGRHEWKSQIFCRYRFRSSWNTVQRICLWLCWSLYRPRCSGVLYRNVWRTRCSRQIGKLCKLVWSTALWTRAQYRNHDVGQGRMDCSKGLWLWRWTTRDAHASGRDCQVEDCTRAHMNNYTYFSMHEWFDLTQVIWLSLVRVLVLCIRGGSIVLITGPVVFLEHRCCHFPCQQQHQQHHSSFLPLSLL